MTRQSVGVSVVIRLLLAPRKVLTTLSPSLSLITAEALLAVDWPSREREARISPDFPCSELTCRLFDHPVAAFVMLHR